MKSIPYSILEQTEWPEDVFIEGGILSRGDTMLIGAESKGGKSTFIAGLIRQLITGNDFIGFKVTKCLKVLYMQAELRESRIKQRLFPTYSKLSDEHKNNLHLWSTNGLILFNEEFKPTIELELLETRPDVLIIDPMLNFHNFNENDAQQMGQFFRMLDRLKSDYDLAIIMAHHFRKASQDPKHKSSLLESIRGSSALRGWAVTTIAMEGRGSSEYRDLEFDLRNSDEPLKRTIRYNPAIKDFDWHDPLTTVKQWAVEYLESRNGSAPTTEQFVGKMLESNHVLGNNRTKAFKMKDSLVGTGVLRLAKVGKTVMVYKS